MRTVNEWIGKSDDTQIPPRVRLRVFDRTNGRCADPSCNRKLMPGHWQCDHIVALANGGRNSESNLQALCEFCHAGKTKTDIATKSKDYRIRRRNAGIRKPRTITRWRKFNGQIVTVARER